MLLILHADSDRQQRESHVDVLAARRYQVQTAGDGVDCVEKLHQSVPDLLILDTDLTWGGSDGVLAIMREEPALRRIPVVMTSPFSSIKTLNDFTSPPVIRALAKPFSLSALLESLFATTTTLFVENTAPAAVDGTPHMELAAGLKREIKTRTGLRVQDLRVDDLDGLIVVRGQVRSFHAKQLVLAAAMHHLAGSGIDVHFDVSVD